MTLKECCRILGVDSSTGLEDVKHAYRRRAFELHPDLNPHLGDAGRQFQLLNEAYVILSRLIAAREARDARLRGEGGEKRADRASEAAAEQAEGRAERDESGSSAQGDGKESGGKASERETERTEQEAPGSTSQPGSDDGAAPGPNAAERPGARKASPQAGGDNLYTEQQEVLRDILNDPFARRVFEDIYSEIRKKGTSASRPSPGIKGKPASEPIRGRKAPVGTGKRAGDSPDSERIFRKSGIDFSQGMGGIVKGWLRSQIDEEQTFHLPAARLFPGARIRLQIRRGLSDSLTTVEVTLPPDFMVGKPIRLKGMGRKVGRWQGDLYLRLVAG